MKTIFHKADSRGHANHGWLDTHHSFSFGNYFNPKRMNFGALRVLNDDVVTGGMGFGSHPHRDMEIITIPLEGALKHGDNMGNSGIIKKGQIQVMSAGTGVVHSEINVDSKAPVKFLQIWITPRELGVTPRYQELTIENNQKENILIPLITPKPEENTLWIHQDAWIFMGNFKSSTTQTYQFQDKASGVYFFLIEGQLKIGVHILNDRDAIGIFETSSFDITVENDAEFILLEVPMIN
ncbi:MAG: pirin family protein [Bacteroidetes bacterium]|jgi:redox-sensitive bicupin YhaK (pirin superfamily)|nr:pirin family protein [Bacteroidota bacterium]